MAEPLAARNYKTICIDSLGHFLQIQWAEIAQHGCQREKGNVGLGRAGELTEPASRVCFHPHGSQEVQETTSEFGTLSLNMLKWRL